MTPGPIEKLSRTAAAAWTAALAVFIAGRGAVLFIMPYNLDELSHAHTSWLYARGWRYMFDDCDFTRSPFLHVFLEPLFRVLGESSLMPYRIFVSILSLAALAVFFLLIRRVAASSAVAAWVSALFALTLPFLMSAQQIRYEPFMLLFFLLGLHFYYVALDRNWNGPLMLLSGALIGLAVAVKFFVAAYALAMLWLFVSSFKRTGGSAAGALRRGTALWFIGAAIPFAPLYLAYKPLIDTLQTTHLGLGRELAGFHASIVLGLSNFPALRAFGREPAFWTMGFLALLLVSRRSKGSSRLEELSRALGTSTLVYLLFLQFVKKQMYLQDIVFPAMSMAVVLGRVKEKADRTRWRFLTWVALAAVGVECVLAAWITLDAPFAERKSADKALAGLRARLASSEHPDRPREVFSALYKLYDRYFFNDLLTRQEQERAIAYFNGHVGVGETALASNSLNVFRESPPAWALGNLVLADQGIEKELLVVKSLPEGALRFVRCLKCSVLADTRTDGMEENLIRELTGSRPKVALVDRFLIDLWFEYPDYLELFDRNYEIRFDEASRRFYAHRREGPWSGFDLPPLPPWDCS